MLFFLKELQEVLEPDEIIYISLVLSEKICANDFINTDVYIKLFDYFSSEIPYGVAKGRTGEPDIWIIDNLKRIYNNIDFSKYTV
tara:strand:+ start:3140 stop:3394 length:255 start_codon:yes stop_codon:yes gene_type:complete